MKKKQSVIQSGIYFGQAIQSMSDQRLMTVRSTAVLKKIESQVIHRRPITAVARVLRRAPSEIKKLTSFEMPSRIERSVEIKRRSRPSTGLIREPKKTYVQQEQIGKGSYAVVRRAVDSNGDSFAMKVYLRDKDQLECVRREIQILHKLQHPNIIKLIDVIYTETEIQLVMELINGINLRELLKQRGGTIEEVQCKRLFMGVVLAVNHCHELRIVHRDIKMENVLISDDQIKLIDFGFSSPEDHKLTTCGTSSYMAPEVLSKVESGRASDIWALGVLLYVLLHGRFPFRANTQSQLYEKIKSGQYVTRGISNSACNLISRMLTLRPFERITAKQILKHQWFQ